MKVPYLMLFFTNFTLHCYLLPHTGTQLTVTYFILYNFHTKLIVKFGKFTEI